VEPGDLLGGGLQSDERASDFGAAVDERLAGLQNQQVFEISAPRRDRVVGVAEHRSAHVRRQGGDLVGHGERRIEGCRCELLVTNWRIGDG
jgi:hypothetical protein